jgi:hypothetical protein
MIARRVGVPAAALALVVTLGGAGTPPGSGPKQRGVSWVGGRNPVTQADFDRLVANGVDWIAQNPFGWQRGLDTPEVHRASSRAWWGERDEGIRVTTVLARQRGIRTMLRPHIWLTGVRDGAWLADVSMKDEADWARWFASYEEFILHYAHLAAELARRTSAGSSRASATSTRGA